MKSIKPYAGPRGIAPVISGQHPLFKSPQTKIGRSTGKLVLTCEICLTRFERYACWAKRCKTSYCSRACAIESKKLPRIKKLCRFCGKEFEVLITEQNRYSGCSDECHRLWIMSSFVGPNIPRNWDKSAKNPNRSAAAPSHTAAGQRAKRERKQIAAAQQQPNGAG